MPSYARRHQLSNSLIYHVYNRSNNRKFIFQEDTDFRHFIDLFKLYSRKFCLKVYHWVIMSNHYHLLLEIEDPARISSFMSGLNRAYTHYYHKQNHSSGLLWQGRFKCQPIQKENYMLSCGRYIERNPVSAKIVKEAYEYPYSSAKLYCLGIADGLTTLDTLYLALSEDACQRQKKYRLFLQDFNTQEEELFRSFENPVGNIEFVRRLIKINGRLIPRRAGRAKE